ncbi:MAG: hypothetical protein WCJ30_07960, partial [Deltaproteobacteria bacterium]
TYLRPDARSLARVDLYTVPGPPEEPGPLVEAVVLVLRGGRVYSRATLEELLGAGHQSAGPTGDEGEVSLQLEFPQERSMRGSVILRWWHDEEDPADMGAPGGPDEVRVDEVCLIRSLHEEEAPNPAPRTSVPPFDPATVDLDEAMDTGAWVGDIAWRMLRPDFTLRDAIALLGGQATSEGGERIALRPRDNRLALAMLTVDGDQVTSARLDVHEGSPLILAIDAVSDRLNAQPIAQPGEITFQFESTRSRGNVSLVLTHGRPPIGPLAAVSVIEVSRE